MPTTILDNETYPEALQRRYAEETKAEKQAEIIRMAEKACAPHQILNTDLVFLERFFNLAFAAGAAHEREACAKVCEERADSYKYATDPWAHEHISEDNTCAASIRTLNNKE